MAGSVSVEQGAVTRPFSRSVLDRFPEYRRDLDAADSAHLSLDEFWALPEIEQEWRRQRLDERRGQCQHCGRPRSECSDPDKLWYPQREVCYATMEREAANAKWRAMHEKKPWHNGSWTSWAEFRSDLHPYHRDFGTLLGVTGVDIRPNDLFLTSENPGPIPTESAQPLPAEADEDPID